MGGRAGVGARGGRGSGRLTQEGKEGLRMIIGSVKSAKFVGKLPESMGKTYYGVEVTSKTGKTITMPMPTAKQAQNLAKQLNGPRLKLYTPLPKQPGSLF